MGTGTPVTEDEIITPDKMNLKIETIGDIGQLPVGWARPSRLYAADGVTLKQLVHSNYSYQAVVANGDRLQMYFICRGNETRLSIGSWQDTSRGIFDLYVNDILDSAGYDEYAAVGAVIHRYILLTQPIRAGANLIELRVNGKNAASTNYFIQVYGASLQ